MALKLNSSGGGSVTLDAPVTANNYTLTAPASSGTLATTDGANTTFTSITDSGNLTFTGTGNRITGDFSNATVANRVMFQTSTTNGASQVEVIPNGSSTISNLIVSSSSTDPANASLGTLFVGSTEVRVQSLVRGTGTYLPLTFYTGGSERMRIDTNGAVGFGVTPYSGAQSGSLALITGGSLYSLGNYIRMRANAVYDGANVVYTTSSRALEYLQDASAGNHVWYTAPSGTAGATVSFTQAMTLNSSGNLIVTGSVTSTGNTPQVTVYTSGSGTYTVPSGCRWLQVEMVGGGGGGGGSGGSTSSGNGGQGGTGGNTTFAGMSANGGVGGSGSSLATGAGGSASLGSVTSGIAASGKTGAVNGSYNTALGLYSAGGMGQGTPLGAYGGGGNGAGNGANAVCLGAGGGSSGYVKAVLTSLSATYAYAVGAAGTAGAAGTNGAAGGDGGAGCLMITAYF